jgi:hypothetical protein
MAYWPKPLSFQLKSTNNEEKLIKLKFHGIIEYLGRTLEGCPQNPRVSRNPG